MTSKFLIYFLTISVFLGLTTSCDEEEEDILVEICNNGIDDDGDGSIDCEDGDCASSYICDQGGFPVKTLTGRLSSLTMNPDTVYVISRFTYMPSGQTLTIKAGALIKADIGDGASATALIIARGAQIQAEGSESDPIIITSILDEVLPGEYSSTLNATTDAGKWGGLIILGKGLISAKDDKGGTTTGIEGVPVADYSQYGGNDNEDNSGTLKYASIRFTGTKLENDDEIQGLTLGGVGSKTTIENVEIISSADDGIEIFGGAVNVKNALISYQADDGLDFDQSYSGTVSNSKVLNYNAAEGNDAFEIDGPEGSSNIDGKFTVENCTFINKGANSRAGTLKSGAQGTIKDCAFVDFNRWITLEGGSATTNYLNNDLEVMDSDFDITLISDAITIFEGDPADIALVKTDFSTSGNTATAVSSKGSSADFSWTLSEELGILD